MQATSKEREVHFFPVQDFCSGTWDFEHMWPIPTKPDVSQRRYHVPPTMHCFLWVVQVVIWVSSSKIYLKWKINICLLITKVSFITKGPHDHLYKISYQNQCIVRRSQHLLWPLVLETNSLRFCDVEKVEIYKLYNNIPLVTKFYPLKSIFLFKMFSLSIDL